MGKNWSIFNFIILYFLLVSSRPVARDHIRIERSGAELSWDLFTDKALLKNTDNDKIIWEGSLLPAIWYTFDGTSLYYSKADVDESRSRVVPSLEYPFWPDWTADGYCIPTAAL